MNAVDVSVRELKNRLSEFLKRAQAGEDVVVTSRGRRIARLSPVSDTTGEPETDQAALQRLAVLPWVLPGKGGRLLGAERRLQWPDQQRPLSEQILDDRE